MTYALIGFAIMLILMLTGLPIGLRCWLSASWAMLS